MKNKKGFIFLASAFIIVFTLSLLSLIYAGWLEDNVDHVFGIRVAVLIVAFASFVASAMFSMIIYRHNITVSKINDDNNRRSELFRELQFVSANYSIIEFNDRMLISPESEWYIPKYYEKDVPSFHLVDKDLNPDEELVFYTIRIPFRKVEGKTASRIEIEKIRFEKGKQKFYFVPMSQENKTVTYLLYNDQTQRSNMIVNIVFNKSSNFFNEELNKFSKIKLHLTVSSVLGVSIDGKSELYFTNPTQTEGKGLHTYRINSSNFITTSPPYLDEEIIVSAVRLSKKDGVL